MSKSIEFELSESFKYAPGNGEEVDAVFIELKEPTGKITEYCCDVESIVSGSIAKMKEMFSDEELEEAKEKAKEKASGEKLDSEELDGDAALAMMNSSGADMRKIVLLFKEIFPIVALVDGEKPLTKPIMDRMHHKDLRKMIGVYVANFIMI